MDNYLKICLWVWGEESREKSSIIFKGADWFFLFDFTILSKFSNTNFLFHKLKKFIILTKYQNFHLPNPFILSTT